MTLDLRADSTSAPGESDVVPRHAPDASLRALHRHLASRLPASVDWSRSATGPTLELSSESPELPRLIEAEVIEGRSLRAVRVPGAPAAGFVAFLDGTQTSRIAWYDGGMPIVHGTVAAVIRVRKNRRMATWRLHRSARVYAPRRLLSASMNAALSAIEANIEIVDTTAAESTDAPSVDHPFAVAEAARHFVQRDRERLEQDLAAQWCNVMSGPLFVDGGIGGSERTASQDCLAGVVKSHRTLYASGAELQRVLRLDAGERSSVFRITSAKRRTAVASWYLRLRDWTGRDPMWGLVRVEMAEPRGTTTAAITARADEISQWVLAEVSPIALPDGRWDKMVYGVRDCEEALRS
jgi:hypothetical protein